MSYVDQSMMVWKESKVALVPFAGLALLGDGQHCWSANMMWHISTMVESNQLILVFFYTQKISL